MVDRDRAVLDAALLALDRAQLAIRTLGDDGLHPTTAQWDALSTAETAVYDARRLPGNRVQFTRYGRR